MSTAERATFDASVAPDTAWFLSHPKQLLDTGSARIAYRRIGTGPPLLLVHGWPFSSLSFRKLARLLSARFSCYLPDTPGLGETVWGPETRFEFAAQAETFRKLVDGLGLHAYALLAHDTGASIARRLAQIDPSRVTRLVLLNTEIPGHRPPWIPLYQRLLALPGSAFSFQLTLRSAAFRRSGMGYGGCFHDPARLDDDFVACFVRPLLASSERMQGVARYLRGIDWAMVDGFATTHAAIRAPVLLVWGADDPTFPVARARPMVSQFADCRGIHEIPAARLLVHEERASEVAAAAIEFLGGA